MTSNSSKNILRHARCIVSASPAVVAKDSIFRKLATALAPSASQIAAEGNSWSPATPLDIHKEDETVKELLHSIREPLNRLWKKVREQEVTTTTTTNSSNSTYGETPPQTIRTLLETIHKEHGESLGDFVDIGSGNGAAAVSAALTGRFVNVRGIESETSRHEQASILQDAYTASPKAVTPLKLEEGDILRNRDILAKASVVFCNSPTWNAQLSGDMGILLDEVPLLPPAIVVSISRRFPSPSMNLVDMFDLPCNGGQPFTFYVCQKAHVPQNADTSSARATTNTSPCMSDTLEILSLLGDKELTKATIRASLDMKECKHDRLAFLTSLASSESGVRIMAETSGLLERLSKELDIDTSDLASRASTSMVLRNMVNFPVGQRALANHTDLLKVLIACLDLDAVVKDHPAVKSNVLDIIGQLLNDPLGYRALTGQVVSQENLASILEQTMVLSRQEEWHGVVAATNEVQVMLRWWGGEQRAMDGGFTFRVL